MFHDRSRPHRAAAGRPPPGARGTVCTAGDETPALLAWGINAGRKPYEHWTLKQIAVQALRDHFPEGATANQLLDVLKAAYGREIERSSLSPQLSRLKEDGIIELDGKLWRLPQKRIEPPILADGGSIVGEGEGAATPEPSLGINTSQGVGA